MLYYYVGVSGSRGFGVGGREIQSPLNSIMKRKNRRISEENVIFEIQHHNIIEIAFSPKGLGYWVSLLFLVEKYLHHKHKLG